MSPTVRALLPSAASEDDDDAPGSDASGAWRWITVVVLPPSIAPVASSTAATTATTRPPTAPATKLAARRFIRREGRDGRLIRRKTRVRREGEEPAQTRKRTRALGQGASQRPPVARRGRLGASRWCVALLAQQAHVAGGVWAGRHAQAPLEIRERRARGIDVAELRQRLAQLLDGPLRAAVEVRAPAQHRGDPEQRDRERHQQEKDEAEQPPV